MMGPVHCARSRDHHPQRRQGLDLQARAASCAKSRGTHRPGAGGASACGRCSRRPARPRGPFLDMAVPAPHLRRLATAPRQQRTGPTRVRGFRVPRAAWIGNGRAGSPHRSTLHRRARDRTLSRSPEARSLISRMPAHHTTYPNSGRQIFGAAPERALRPMGDVEITGEFLWAYGTISVPGAVWRALQRLGSWVEPVLVSEWARLMRSYAERMALPMGAGTA